MCTTLRAAAIGPGLGAGQKIAGNLLGWQKRDGWSRHRNVALVERRPCPPAHGMLMRWKPEASKLWAPINQVRHDIREERRTIVCVEWIGECLPGLLAGTQYSAQYGLACKAWQWH